MLRANLLGPVRDLATLEMRLDTVEALLAGEAAFLALSERLGKLRDTDAIFSSLVAVPRVATPRTARAALAAVIGLKHTLELLPSIAAAITPAALEGGGSILLSLIGANLTTPALSRLAARIDEVVTEDTTLTRSAVAMRQQECFAVRWGCGWG